MNPRPFEVGERVFDVTIGWGTVTRIMPYEVRVQPNEGSNPRSYHADGRYFSTNKYRSLYHADEVGPDGVLRIQVEPKMVKLFIFLTGDKEPYSSVTMHSRKEAESFRESLSCRTSEIKEIEFELEEER